jgi:hypothetical protein
LQPFYFSYSLRHILHALSFPRQGLVQIAKMKLPPLDVILTWPAPNYTNPITRGDALVIINSIFIVLVTITVGLRMYTRLVIKRWFGIDDVFILLALVSTVTTSSAIIPLTSAVVHCRADRHRSPRQQTLWMG